MENIQVLSLVFMNTLCLHIEDGLDRDSSIGPVSDKFCKGCLVLLLHVVPSSSELRITGEVFEFRDFVFEAGDPFIAYGVRDELSEAGVTQRHPSAGGHAVGDVMKLRRRD